MIKINKKVEYALIALKYIASQKSQSGEEKLVSAREICDRFKTPFDTTAKVLQIMNNNGILNSTKGIKGGYSLSQSLGNITFSQLNRMIEQKESTQKFCASSKGMCDLYSICNIVTPLEALNNKINHYLEELTLEDLLMENEHFVPQTENA